MSRDNRSDPTDYAVFCMSGCTPTLQFLTAEQELAGLKNPDAPWLCPKCGEPAEWDDDCRATNPPDEEQDIEAPSQMPLSNSELRFLAAGWVKEIPGMHQRFPELQAAALKYAAEPRLEDETDVSEILRRAFGLPPLELKEPSA